MDKLPIVSSEICAAVSADIAHGPMNDYMVELLGKLALENPQVANFIALYSMQASDPTIVGCCGLLVYRLLESQLEANALKEEFK